MRYLDVVDKIAEIVYNNLNLPEDVYKTFDSESAKAFKEQYLSDTAYLRSMVADEIYDFPDIDDLDLSPTEYAILLDDIVDEVSDLLEDELNKYAAYQNSATEFTFHEIIQAINDLSASSVSSIEDVETVLVDERLPKYEVNIKLDNGAVITMEVTFDEDYYNI